MKRIRKFGALLTAVAIMLLTLTGCDLFDSKINSLKGSLLGVSYIIEFYDNSGALFMTASGQNIDITSNKISEQGFNSEGNVITTYSLSSIINITIDGSEIQSCGSTVIFSETGMSKDVDFQLTDINSQSDGSLTDLTSIAKIVNHYKNFFGKSRVVVIQSQLGNPICAYSGDDVYWEIPEELPKTTKLMIDGKALYIHRANFQIIDKDLL